MSQLKIYKVLGLWNSRNLSLEERKISKIVYLSLLTDALNTIINEIQSIQKNFSWKSSRPKINHKTLYNKFDDGLLKNNDVNQNQLACNVSGCENSMMITFMGEILFRCT